MDFNLFTVVCSAIAAVIVFGIMYLRYRGVDLKDGIASKLYNITETLVAKYETEIKAYDTANNTTYWTIANDTLTQMKALLTNENMGIMDYVKAMLAFEPIIEKILTDTGLKSKFE